MQHFFSAIKATAFLCIVLLHLHVCAQTAVEQNTTPVKTPVVIGESIKLQSAILNEEYSLYISTPHGYDKSTAKYPVVYVLDGKYYFPYVSSAVDVLAGNNHMPECIVVGIASNNRNRDYSPPLMKGFDKPGPMAQAGGADTYLQHLEQEVLPFIDKNYRTQPYRILIGHSLGGLLVVHAMTAKPNLFQANVDIEGSLWFNNGANGDALISYFKQHPAYKGNFMFVMEKMDSSYWFPITHRLHNYLAKEKPQGLNYEFIEIENEQHATLIFPGAYTALRQLFTNYGYQFNPTTNLDEIKHHYDSLSNVFNYRVDIPEDIYDEDKDHCMMILKNSAKAILTCNEWIKTYPNSARAYESTGMLYIDLGNKKEAKKYLEKSLELNPDNKGVKESLQKLGAG